MFIQYLQNDPFFFVSVVITVIASITLHELAHGWMAIRLGDHTPLKRQRMTLNPLVHMGPWSLIALAVAGIAWGQMPIDPTRLRGKYAESFVALAGPFTNLLLGFAALTALGLWMRWDPRIVPGDMASTQLYLNIGRFLRIFGFINWMLFLFNLLPIPPLDGSHVAANLSRSYARFLEHPNSQVAMMCLFALVFFGGTPLFQYCNNASWNYLSLLSGYHFS